MKMVDMYDARMIFSNVIYEQLDTTDDTYDLWHEWISEGRAKFIKNYTNAAYTEEEEQRRAKLILGGPYGRVIILAWLQSRK
jgi:hypothetical protein